MKDFKGGPIVEQCKTAGIINKDGEPQPCVRIDGECCTTYISPETQWHRGGCPFRYQMKEVVTDHKTNPLKASKQKAKKS